MRSILFDTSTEKAFVAIAHDRTFLFHAELPSGQQSAQELLPALDRALRALNLTLSHMAYVATGIGPGSYTGIRVGATIAKTIALACNIPLIGICSLDLFVPSNPKEKTFAAVIDAKIGGLYVQKGIVEQGIPRKTAPPEICLSEKAAELLHDTHLIVTPKAAPWKAKLEAQAGTSHWDFEECYPSAFQMLRIAEQRYFEKNYSLDTKIELLYMRKTQAEIERGA